jgi:cytochrome b561
LRYSRTAIALHWLMAVMILASLSLGLYMVDLSISPQKLKYYSWHKWAGVTIFVLAAVRLLWRLTHRAPTMPAMPRWQALAAHTTHFLLYVAFFAAPLTGWLFSSAKGFQTVYFGVIPLPDLIDKNDALAEIFKQSHVAITYALGALVALHIAAALKHQFINKDGLLLRIMPGRKSPKTLT